MGSLQEFLDELRDTDEVTIVDFCRRKVMHGTPFLFANREEEFYAFRKRVASFAEVEFHEVFIAGSGKLGFSPMKRKDFDWDSDVDVAIVSSDYFERVLENIYDYQMEIRRNRLAVSESEMKMYHSFLEYTILGWIRPDKLPTSFKVGPMKQTWFDFFKSISNGNSEAGNYKISGGVFKSYRHFERYTLSGLTELATSLRI